MIIVKLTIALWMIAIVSFERIFWLSRENEKIGLYRAFICYVVKNKITAGCFAVSVFSASILTVVSAIWLLARG